MIINAGILPMLIERFNTGIIASIGHKASMEDFHVIE